MHCAKTYDDESIFAKKFSNPSHRYPIYFSENNFTLPECISQKSKYKVSVRSIFHFGTMFCQALRKEFKKKIFI